MKKLLVLLVALLLVGCVATTTKMNTISLGMSKAEVIKIMGPPISTSAMKGVEYMKYNLSQTPLLADVLFGESSVEAGYPAPYFIRIINGKVDAYGRLGDFDSTKIPENKTTIDLNINQETPSP